MFRIGPGAAGAIEPVRLVHAEETASLLYDSPLTANGISHSFQRAPPRCSSLVVANAFDIIFAHRVLHSAGDISPGDKSRFSHQRMIDRDRERARQVQVKLFL